MVESWAICDYLDQTAMLAGTKTLLPGGGEPRIDALARVARAHSVAEKAVALVYETTRRPEAKQWDEWIARLREQVQSGVGELERDADQLERAAAPVDTSDVIANVVCIDYIAHALPDINLLHASSARALSARATAEHEAFAVTQPGTESPEHFDPQ